MAKFSERYGYTRPSDVIIREKITEDIQNAICSCYDRLRDYFFHHDRYLIFEKYIWTYFENEREGNYKNYIVATAFIENASNPWFKKLDLIEMTIDFLYQEENNYDEKFPLTNRFVSELNSEFKRLNFAYRIINNKVVEITAKEEIETIQKALENPNNNIKIHLSNALELYSKRPEGNYRNSIKESISAVEVYCREKTGENTLGKALEKLKYNSIIIPKILENAFSNLYNYTNQPETGIRHALMDDEGTYTPKEEEALFMLVSCSAFINYLCKKTQ